MKNGKDLGSEQSASDTLMEAVQIVLDSLPTLQAALSESYAIRRSEVTSTNQGKTQPYQERTYLMELTLTPCELKVFIALVYLGSLEDKSLSALGTKISEGPSEVAAAIASMRETGLLYRVVLQGSGTYRLTWIGYQVYDQMSEDGYDPELAVGASLKGLI